MECLSCRTDKCGGAQHVTQEECVQQDDSRDTQHEQTRTKDYPCDNNQRAQEATSKQEMPQQEIPQQEMSQECFPKEVPSPSCPRSSSPCHKRPSEHPQEEEEQPAACDDPSALSTPCEQLVMQSVLDEERSHVDAHTLFQHIGNGKFSVQNACNLIHGQPLKAVIGNQDKRISAKMTADKTLTFPAICNLVCASASTPASVVTCVERATRASQLLSGNIVGIARGNMWRLMMHEGARLESGENARVQQQISFLTSAMRDMESGGLGREFADAVLTVLDISSSSVEPDKRTWEEIHKAHIDQSHNVCIQNRKRRRERAELLLAICDDEYERVLHLPDNEFYMLEEGEEGEEGQKEEGEENGEEEEEGEEEGEENGEENEEENEEEGEEDVPSEEECSAEEDDDYGSIAEDCSTDDDTSDDICDNIDSLQSGEGELD